MTTHKERDFILEHCKDQANTINDIVLAKAFTSFWDTFSKHELKLTNPEGKL